MTGAGKGSTPRPVNPTIYGSNYNDIFKKTNAKTNQRRRIQAVCRKTKAQTLGATNHRHIQIDIRNLPADTEAIEA